jgi:hypothetical protein
MESKNFIILDVAPSDTGKHRLRILVKTGYTTISIFWSNTKTRYFIIPKGVVFDPVVYREFRELCLAAVDTYLIGLKDGT